MPINKNAYLRYRILDELISQGNIERQHLLDELNLRLEGQGGTSVAIETLDGDIRFLKQEFKAPIICSRKRGYYYEEEDYRIFTNELEKAEIKALDFAINVLNGNSHIALIREAQSVLNKIFRKATERKREGSTIISESNLQVQGVEFLEPLHEAILEEKCIIIEHRSIRQKKIVKHYFSPYALKEYRGLWYVIGYSAEKEFTINLALDRIKIVRDVAGVSFYRDPAFNLNRYFKHSIGITTLQSGKPSRVRFWVSADSVYFLKIQPLHATQRIMEEDEKGAVVQMDVYLSEELTISLLGLGSRIKVLDPPELIASVKVHVEKMKKFYSA
jgi:predicted DNA-binding transcriptional regulator YafY